MGSLAACGRTAGEVHSIGWHIVRCPKNRKRVLVGDVATRLVKFLQENALER
jgi:REP element-mobilizing transposase RayT